MAIPLILATIGLVSTGVLANFDHEKSLSHKRDQERREEIEVIKSKLSAYYAQEKKYPEQKNQSVNGQEVLKKALGEIPEDPTSDKLSYGYWSDGKVYNLIYFSESKRSQEIVFSND